MPGPCVDIGREVVLFVNTETTYGTDPDGGPIAADANRVIDAQVGGKYPVFDREDKTGTSSTIFGGNEKKTTQFTAGGYLLPAGAGVAPDMDELLTAGGWTKTVASDDATDGVSTTTVLAISGHAYVANEFVEVGGEVRRIASVVAATSITVTPALTTAPANPTSVQGCTSYNLKDARADGPDGLTIWRKNNRSMERIQGGAPEQFEFTMGGTGGAKWTCEGQGRRHDLLVATLLNGSLTNVATSIIVDNGGCVPADVSATNVFYMQAELEVLEIIGVSGSTLTSSTRGMFLHGGAAATHADNVELFPAFPTGTFAGSIVDATSGDAIINGLAAEITEATVRVGMGLTFLGAEHGDAFTIPSKGYIQNNAGFDVTVDLTARAQFDGGFVDMIDATNRTAREVLLQQGDTSGTIFAIYMERVRFEVPEVAGGDDEVTLGFTGKAKGTTTGQDDIYVVFA